MGWMICVNKLQIKLLVTVQLKELPECILFSSLFLFFFFFKCIFFSYYYYDYFYFSFHSYCKVITNKQKWKTQNYCEGIERDNPNRVWKPRSINTTVKSYIIFFSIVLFMIYKIYPNRSIYHNSLYGSIPTQLGNLKQLQHV